MRARWVAGFLLLLGATAAAQEIKAPQIIYPTVGWDAALAALGSNEGVRRLPALSMVAATPAPNHGLLARLNQATSSALPTIAASPVPVLLPVNLDAYSADKPKKESVPEFSAPFGPPKFFLTGPGGYDAAFTVDMPNTAQARPAREIEIHISGMAMLYDVGERVGGEDKPPIGLQADFPDLRRLYLEGHMRYLFTRYGVLYSVSIECVEGRSNSKRLSCQDAHDVVVPFLKALTVAGGMPHAVPSPAGSPAADRPANVSDSFAYYATGQLISGTGARHYGGHPESTVFSKIRFPLAEAPAQTYSQLFMNVGDCTEAVGDSQTTKRRGAPFQCPAAARVAAGGRSMYPWRDNFCETRGFMVGQCPSGIGHQGEDIVPVDCRMSMSSLDADRCERKEHAVVAVRDGTVLRSRGQEGLIIVVNQANEHVRFRYLHMNPKLIDEDGFLSGRTVREGETIGKVGNYSGREAGTSYHLHFDMQVPTKDGWVLVNPYMTLVLGYERLIGARGTELRDNIKEVREPAPIVRSSLRETASVTSADAAVPASKQKKPSPYGITRD